MNAIHMKAIFIATRLHYINMTVRHTWHILALGPEKVEEGAEGNKDDFGFTAGSNREVFYHQSSETCTLVVVDDG